jgi:hypothetical protein
MPYRYMSNPETYAPTFHIQTCTYCRRHDGHVDHAIQVVSYGVRTLCRPERIQNGTENNDYWSLFSGMGCHDHDVESRPNRVLVLYV